MTQRRKSLKSRKIATKKPRAPQILLSVSLTKEYIPIISSKFQFKAQSNDDDDDVIVIKGNFAPSKPEKKKQKKNREKSQETSVDPEAAAEKAEKKKKIKEKRDKSKNKSQEKSSEKSKSEPKEPPKPKKEVKAPQPSQNRSQDPRPQGNNRTRSNDKADKVSRKIKREKQKQFVQNRFTKMMRSGNQTFEICVSNLPKKATQESVQDYFDACGTITKLEFKGEENRAFIEFETAQGVANALEINEIKWEGVFLKIEKAGQIRKQQQEESGDKGEFSKTLFVGNINTNTTEDALKKFFGTCGPIDQVRFHLTPDGKVRFELKS